MTTVRVIVPTTEDAAEVQSLTEEAPVVRSVVCLDRTATALAISADYDAFVRQPTGVVERLWGHPAFRLDVSAAIEEGRSWQLGVFLAHGLHAAGRLARRGEAAGLVVWATGEVDAELAVRPVESVPRKLTKSRQLFARLAAEDTPLLVLVPRGAEVSEHELPPRATVREVAHAAEALAALGLAGPGVSPARAAPRRGRWPTLAVAALALAVFALPIALAASWADPLRNWRGLGTEGKLVALDETLTAVAAAPGCLTCVLAAAIGRRLAVPAAPDPAALVLAVEEVRGSRFGPCDSSAPAVTIALRPGEPAVIRSTAASACLVRYRVSGAPEVALLVLGRRSAHASGAGQAVLDLTVPRWLAAAEEVRVIGLGATVGLQDTLNWLSQLSADPEGDATLIRRLVRLGIAARVLRHEFAPRY